MQRLIIKTILSQDKLIDNKYKNILKFCYKYNSYNYQLIQIRKLSNENKHNNDDDKTKEINKIDNTIKDKDKSDKKVEINKEEKDNIISSVTKKAASSLGSATLHYTYEFNRLYFDLEKSLSSKINEANRRRIIIILTIVIVTISIIFLLFKDKIRKKISDETADFAKETLENESLKIQTQELAMAVVQTILNDKEITSNAAGFLREASSVQQTQQALLQLTIHVLQHPDSLNEVTILAKKLIDNISHDEESISKLGKMIAESLKNPIIKKVVVDIIIQLANDPKVLEVVTELSLKVIHKPEILKAISDLLSEASKEVLKNDQVVNQSRDFVADVMGDDKVQREGGDAIWNSISHALSPGLRRFAGVGLIAVSLAIIQVFLSPF